MATPLKFAGLLLLSAPAAHAQSPAKPFDATTAWTSFETLLRERYGYFDRPGIDGNAINHWIAPWLTSIRIPYESFGRHVVAQLASAWGGSAAADINVAHEPLPAASVPVLPA